MPQSLAYNYIHFVTSTKNRKKIILPEIKKELFGYISGICTNLESPALQIGGVEDHIHVLFILSKKKALIKWVEEVKKSSSKWMKTRGTAFQNFYWQDGYGAFSVNPKEVNVVKQYIANQEEHHNAKTFQDEYRAFLKQYNVPYDERYVWD